MSDIDTTTSNSTTITTTTLSSITTTLPPPTTTVAPTTVPPSSTTLRTTTAPPPTTSSLIPSSTTAPPTTPPPSSSSPSSIPPSSSSSESSSERPSSTFTPETIVTTRTSISYATFSSESTSVSSFTQGNGAIGYTTITEVVIASSAAATITSASSYTTTPTALAGSDGVNASSGLSTGAKAGIGAGIAIAVVIAAAFGFWYSWFQRRKRRRISSDESQYAHSTLPAMSYGSGGRDYGAGSALGAGLGYTDRSETRSELPSPPMGSPDPLMGNRPNDRLFPAAAGPVSWGSSQQNPSDAHSVSDYGDATKAGAVTSAYPAELGENDHVGALAGRTLSNGSQHNNRGSMGQSPYPDQGTLPSRNLSGHSRTLSDSSHHASAYHNSMGSDNPYAAELQGGPNNQASELEGNGMSRRMSSERKPYRPGHSSLLFKNNGMDPSQNF
ncbi:uncharacterized protein AB675_9221 [Cyphellophora attinorum]|uniref:Mid2 domain-containing protein n=1 Tax=Cyphellophora attinorum TaxID=1664694 RepID=A0A0N0NNA7_9EURO|nr:uncharacterized protein AB675_9221 [Phialophora attinorum]KPI41401.1 hypothetical protein AB675_9221 [Phialophora attinorum]